MPYILRLGRKMTRKKFSHAHAKENKRENWKGRLLSQGGLNIRNDTSREVHEMFKTTDIGTLKQD